MTFTRPHGFAPGRISGKGILSGVADADGVFVSTQVRLAHCDVPETGQPGYDQAMSFLRLVQTMTRKAEWEFVAIDDYGRLVAEVWPLDWTTEKRANSLSCALVRKGLAWATDDVYAAEEKEARDGRRGIWKRKNNIPPWEWRKGKRL
ncbi:MAG: thermonuclease family protein [Bryobacteraceae bacterium]